MSSGVGFARPGAALEGEGLSSSRRLVIFSVVSLALFMSAVDGTIVATGLPTIGHALGAKLNWTSWTITAYQLGLVVAMPVAGRLSDRLGRKRVFIAAAILFTASSLACGFSRSIGLLIALRVVQAIGGAAFVPAASGIVADVYGDGKDRALGFFSSIFPLGALVGPILGGILIATWSWRGIFLVNVPVGVVFTMLGVRYLPRSKPVGGRIDLIGAGLLGGAVLGTMLAITHAGNADTPLISFGTLGPFAGAVICAVTFLRRSSRIPDPLIPLMLLREKSFAVMNGINFVWGACAIGFGSLVPVFAQDRYGLSPLASGTLLTARAVGEIGIAALASVFIRRTGYRLPMIVGFLLIAAGLACIALPPVVFGPYTWLALGAALTGIGTGASAPAANNATIQLSPDDIGAISGLRGAARQAGAIVAVAVTTSLVARSGSSFVTLGRSFFVLAALLALITPLVFAVPDNDRDLVAV
ncbi:MAG: transporter [Acidimicrobiaceae bacterium]|nr:transporter [Acidimicrobiaceae bacterium]